jgi:hypothetical protein
MLPAPRLPQAGPRVPAMLNCIVPVVALAAGVAIDDRVAGIARDYPQIVTPGTIGTSRHGRPLHLLTLAAPGDEPWEHRPALLVVAGVHGQHLVGVETALGVAERLARDHAEALANVTVYVVPALNADSIAFHAGDGHGIDFGRTLAPYDADRDGRIAEDPGEDVSGDGLITMMRVHDPAPGSGLARTHIPDPDEPRLMRPADPAKGEAPTHAYVIEGIDNDRDGEFNEDGVGGSAGGGVLLDRNFPVHWPEHTEGCGITSLSEPEARAFVRFVLDHPHIVAAVIYGMRDSIVNLPEAGKLDPSGRVPTGIDEADKPYLEELSKQFREITGMTDAPRGEGAGSAWTWLYAGAGILAIETPVWVRPDLVKRAEPGPDDAEPAAEPAPAPPDEPEVVMVGSLRVPLTPEGVQAAMASAMAMNVGAQQELMAAFMAPAAETQAKLMALSGGAPGAPQPPARAPQTRRTEGGRAPKKDGSDDAKWLAYSDTERGGAGFVEWASVEHPALGTVEVGGFVPSFRVNPPDDDLPRLADEQAAFAARLISKLPRLEVEVPQARRVGEGVWRISLCLRNAGYLPTRSAMGVRADRIAPDLVLIDLPPEAIISGAKVRRFPAVPGSGASVEPEWLVAAPDGATVSLVLRSAVLGERVLDVVLREPPAPAPGDP